MAEIHFNYLDFTTYPVVVDRYILEPQNVALIFYYYYYIHVRTFQGISGLKGLAGDTTIAQGMPKGSSFMSLLFSLWWYLFMCLHLQGQ